MLYNNPEPHVKDGGIPYDPQRLDDLDNHLPKWDMSAYLPEATLQWCTRTLLELGFDPYTPNIRSFADREEPFKNVYLQLRELVRDHIVQGLEPTLSLLPNPTGSWEYEVSVV